MERFRLRVVAFYAKELFYDDSSEEEADNVIEKVDKYAEFTVPNMNDNQFQVHFRATAATFQSLCQKVAICSQREENRVGFPRMIIEKELMITLWYIGNLESFR